MDKQNLINELTIGLIDCTSIPAIELKQRIESLVSDYSVSKMQTTLPSTGDGSASMYLFHEYTKYKIAEGIKPNTIQCYQRSLDQLYSHTHKEFNLMTTKDIVEFLDYYRLSGVKGERKPNTVRNMYLNLSSFFTWLYNNKYMSENIMATIKAPKGQVPNKVVVSDSEMEKMVIHCESENPLKRARNIALLNFLKDSGVRVSEFVNLNIEDIDFSNRIIYVKNGKGGKDRSTTFSEKTYERLMEYFSLRKDVSITNGNVIAETETPLFSTLYRRKGRLTTDGVRGILKSMNPRLYPHLMRATCCTNLIMKGTTPVVVQSMMGHASMDMTNRYTKISPEQMQDAMRRAL